MFCTEGRGFFKTKLFTQTSRVVPFYVIFAVAKIEVQRRSEGLQGVFVDLKKAYDWVKLVWTRAEEGQWIY